MKKIENIQSRKAVSAYGGSGSIIETKDNGSLLVLPYDDWKCFSPRNRKKLVSITDRRLLKEIQKLYPNVVNLYRIPEGDSDANLYNPSNLTIKNSIGSDYCPRWFYCPKCRRLHKLEDWRQKWDVIYPNDGRFGKNPPACYSCSNQIGGNRYRRYCLEQIRFLLASPDNGEIKDIPFDKIWNLPKDSQVWNIGKDIKGADEELYYRTSQGGDGLQSLYIQKGQNGDRINMVTIYRKYFVYGNNAYRVHLRNGNYIYYPNILACIYIPRDLEDKVWQLKNIGFSDNEIYSFGEKNGLNKEQIDAILNDESVDLSIDEFNYITNQRLYGNNNVNNSDRYNFCAVRYPNLKSPSHCIKGIYALRRLKETSVLMSYTRVIPDGNMKKWWSVEDEKEIDDKQPKTCYPFRSPLTVDFMPAVESFGEGILVELDIEQIKKEDRYIFAHTFSHLVMKELEFQCGYPVTSMKEKMYAYQDESRMGFLIYTIAGSEGSYGGLISLLPNDTNSSVGRILKIIEMAALRASNCPNDPICKSEEGHCFTCVDLPEISCQNWNNNLNRDKFVKCLANHQSDSASKESTLGAMEQEKFQDVTNSKQQGFETSNDNVILDE